MTSTYSFLKQTSPNGKLVLCLHCSSSETVYNTFSHILGDIIKQVTLYKTKRNLNFDLAHIQCQLKLDIGSDLLLISFVLRNIELSYKQKLSSIDKQICGYNNNDNSS